jgi:endonuclease/exonuclease/phosphatase (EEP) superfamily protein YafD
MRKLMLFALPLLVCTATRGSAQTETMQQRLDAAAAQATAVIMNLRGQAIADQADEAKLIARIQALQTQVAELTKAAATVAPPAAPPVCSTVPAPAGAKSTPAEH